MFLSPLAALCEPATFIQAGSLPLTSTIPLMKLSLQKIQVAEQAGLPSILLSLKTQPWQSESIGWTYWNTIITDGAGKTIESRGSTPSRIRVDGTLATIPPWIVKLNGKEFISSDTALLPVDGEVRTCAINSRASLRMRYILPCRCRTFMLLDGFSNW